MRKNTITNVLGSVLFLLVASPAQAEITTPAPGTTIEGNTATFEWDDAGSYWMYIGSTPHQNDLGSLNLGSATSITVSNLPGDSRTIYVQLFTNVGGTYSSRTYTYTNTGDNTLATITNPAPFSILNSTSITFS